MGVNTPPVPQNEPEAPAPKLEAAAQPPDARPLPPQGGAAKFPDRPEGEKPLASPAVRRRAEDMGVKLSYVAGTGPAGRIEHADLDAFIASKGQTTGPQSGGSSYAQRTAVEEIKVIGLRRKIAEKMQDAKRRIPHFAYVEEVDMTELEALRAHLNATHKDRGKLTVLPFFMRALVRVLPKYPQINARFDDDAGVVRRHAAVHIGIATQTPGGLIVPVVRHAETLDLWAAAAEVARVSVAARENKARSDELSGSTITITSLGPLGGIATTPVINHPEVAIIGPNKIVERPVVRGGQVVVRKMMNLSSSFDHRVVDGYDAADFIQRVKDLLEHPATLFID
jgi:2-oxoisovalerate dehydrogenase E2 component (dihydrolipoyl transacylase)